MATWSIPMLPASAGALLRDADGGILLLAPAYKTGWTVPGGIMEADESPWDGCRREVLEETGLVVEQGRLACVDTRPARRGPLGLRFLFDCGTLDDDQVASIVVQPSEVRRYQFAPPERALQLLRPAVSRRVAAALGSPICVYLEDGMPVAGVSD